MEKLIFTFHSVSDALFFEKMAKGQFCCKVIAAPRALSSSCGYAVMVHINGDMAVLSAFLAEKEIDFFEAFLEKDDGFTVVNFNH